MNAEEKIHQQVADDLAAGEEAVRKSRVRLAYFRIGIGLLLTLFGMAVFLFSDFSNRIPTLSLLLFGGITLALQAFYDLRKQKRTG